MTVSRRTRSPLRAGVCAWRVAIVLVAAFLIPAAPANALERAAVPAGGGTPESDWDRAGICPIQYWNTCVGWSWLWGGWNPDARIGVAYRACSDWDGFGGYLNSVDIFTRFHNDLPVPPGYGFTALLEAYAADENHCPVGAALGSTPFLPDGTTQNVAFAQPVVVPTNFVALVRMGPQGSGSAWYGSDFDVEGPTGGPQACGTCYPTTRSSHSFYYGTSDSPICPGGQLSIICEVEWRWVANMEPVGYIGVESTSWGQIKDLYR